MGRSASNAVAGSAGVITTSSDMPISGKFGTGRVVVISSTQAFIIPATSIRVRLWGAGGGSTGAGGGFAMKVLSGLTIGQSVTATIGVRGISAAGGSTSFGAYLSASGGTSANSGVAGIGGVGVGGDVNTTGGASATGSYGGGGGAANLLGRGGAGGEANAAGESAASGGGGGGTSAYAGTIGGFGIAPSGEFGIDLMGCGSGTSGPAGNAMYESPSPPNAGNGGGGGSGKAGAFPGGGGGAGKPGADGFMIVEF